MKTITPNYVEYFNVDQLWNVFITNNKIQVSTYDAWNNGAIKLNYCEEYIIL